MTDIKINFTNKEEPRVVNESFYDWFKNQLIVTGFPKEHNVDPFDVVINVSDEFSHSVYQYCVQHHKQYFWFPMSECNSNMGLHSIYGAMNILRSSEALNLKVLLHCHAGANRSPSVKESYYAMITGEEFTKEKTPRIVRNIEFGHLPAFYEYKHFLDQIFKKSGLETCIYRTMNHK